MTGLRLAISGLLTSALCAVNAFGVVDERAATPRDERQEYAAWVGFRPAEGQVCQLNPPRLSWPYNPGTIVPRPEKRSSYNSQKKKVRARAFTKRVKTVLTSIVANSGFSSFTSR